MPEPHPRVRTRVGRFQPTAGSRHFLLFDGALSRAERVAWSTATAALLPEGPSVTAGVELRVIADPTHPAFRQCGLFVARRIPAHTTVACYAGIVQLHASMGSSQAYCMGYGGVTEDLEVDAEFCGNVARFANDPRNTPNSANVVAQSQRSRLGEGFTAIVSKRALLPGEEVLLDYGRQHRLCAQPWLDRRGKRLTRPHAVQPPTTPAAQRLQQELALWWQCAQCGWWSPQHPRPTDALVALCRNCGHPRHAGMKVAATVVDRTAASAPAKRPRSPCAATAADAAIVDSAAALPTAREAGTREAAVPAPWPLAFPHVPWQVWDPEVPHSLIMKYSHFAPQTAVHVAEIRDEGPALASPTPHRVPMDSVHRGVFCADVVEPGRDVCVLGGLVLPRCDHRTHTAQLCIALPEAQDMPGADTDPAVRSAAAAVVPPLALVVTNEGIHLRGGGPTSHVAGRAVQLQSTRAPVAAAATGASVIPALRRAAEGYFYVALVALRRLGPNDELLL